MGARARAGAAVLKVAARARAALAVAARAKVALAVAARVRAAPQAVARVRVALVVAARAKKRAAAAPAIGTSGPGIWPNRLKTEAKWFSMVNLSRSQPLSVI